MIILILYELCLYIIPDANRSPQNRSKDDPREVCTWSVQDFTLVLHVIQINYVKSLHYSLIMGPIDIAYK